MSAEEAKKNLRDVLPFLRIAMEMAQLQEPGGEVGLAVVVTKPDKSGKITATFHGR